MRYIRTNDLADERGNSLIEFTVVLPVLVMLVLGIARFGIAFNNNIVLTDAVRTGARVLAVSRGTSDPCSPAGTKTVAAATSLAAGSLTMTATVYVNGIPGTAVSRTGTGSVPTCVGQGVLMSAGSDATMLATYPCSIRVFGVNFAPGCTLTAQTTVRVE